MRKYKVTVFLKVETSNDTDPEVFKEVVKDAMMEAIDADSGGEEDLDFYCEEEEDF